MHFTYHQCHLHSQTSEPLQDTITLNVKSNEEFSKPTHLAYYVAGAQLTGCQPGERSSNFETAVDLRYPDVIDP